jgi:hypothetical protein
MGEAYDDGTRLTMAPPRVRAAAASSVDGTVASMRRRMPLTATVILALALAACGGSSSSSSGGGSSTTSTTGGTGESAGFAELAAKGKDAQVKVSYRSRDRSGTFTIAQYRGDSFVSFGNDTIYGVGGATVTCQGTGADAQCFALPGPADVATTVVQSFFGAYAGLIDRGADLSDTFSSVTTSTSTETIAGRAAECATVEASAFGGTGSATVCLDRSSGVLLRIGSGSGTDLITATSYAEATAADVTPPATPQTLGG